MADFLNPVSQRDVHFVERYKSIDNAYTTTGSKVITVTTAGNAGLRAGFVRLRTKSVNASSINTFNISGNDGTTTVECLPTTVASAAGVLSDITVPFQFDIAATSFTLTVTLTGNGNETVDFEVAGCR